MRYKQTRWQIVTGLLALLTAVVLVGCGVADTTKAMDSGAAAALTVAEDLGPDVAPEVVADLNEQGTITVVDVREDWEYAAGHIAEAQLIPLGTLKDRLEEIPADRPVVLVCRSGNRSGQAFRFLRQQGFENVHNMTGGMLAWEAAGLEMEK
ncbi:MAG: rhodanese-like domain-containing protein [Anaerolineae bacterium]